MLRLTWTENALEDLDWWQQHDAKMLKRIIHAFDENQVTITQCRFHYHK